jgi:hypothetical protein
VGRRRGGGEEITQVCCARKEQKRNREAAGSGGESRTGTPGAASGRAGDATAQVRRRRGALLSIGLAVLFSLCLSLSLCASEFVCVCVCWSDGGDGGGRECRKCIAWRRRTIGVVVPAEEDCGGGHGRVRARQERRRGGRSPGPRSRVRRRRHHQQGRAPVARRAAAAARLPRRLPRDHRPGTHTYFYPVF